MKVPWRAQSLSTLVLDTYKHSLRHRFRALARQLGFALAPNFCFQHCFGHWRLPLEGYLHWRRYSCCIPFDTSWDPDLKHWHGCTRFQHCFRHWRLPLEGFLHWRRYLCCTGSDTCFGTDMDTCFDTDLVGTGKVALAFQNCFRHWRLPREGFLHWRRYLCCTRSNTDEGPMEGAVAFNTRLGTNRHSLQHRFWLLAWHSLATGFQYCFWYWHSQTEG
ncbi:hypothetical protein INT47_003559 [Mucor saturninus]|uniref:Uncharacterized protein n=1 Tax=Mucor saturninus TaxID=64648 RepID=A0A8H7QTB3_9FUNG|nr:hypothetical protein INT47_003559 [Mucor saturninus]